MGESLQLQDVFPPTSMEQWRAVVERDLKGADFERRLVRRTLEGLEISPLYAGPVADVAGAAGRAPWIRGRLPEPARWRMAQPVREPTVSGALGAIGGEVDGGATGVALVLGKERGGVDVRDAESFGEILHALPESVGLSIDAGALAPTARDWLLQSGWSGRGEVNLDPLGTLARAGRWPVSAEEGQDEAVRSLPDVDGPIRVLACSALETHAAGASDAQALGWLLSSGAAWLRAAERNGVPLERVASQLVFHVPVGTEMFKGIALIRALRACWGRMLSACGVAGTAFVHAHPAVRMLTRRDPWVNMLRNTVAVAAAGMAGADVVTSTPFDAALGLPEALGRRVARNTHHLLLDESHLARVLDPAGGSWFAEDLTRQLAELAWTQMQTCEAAGGLARALLDGSLATACDESWAQLRRDVARRKRPITGVSMYPLAGEVLLERQVVASSGQGLGVRRLAGPWEALRDAADAAQPRPRAVLCCLGPLAEHSARLTWTENLLVAGGFTVERVDAPTVEAKPVVVCLVGKDSRYAAEGVDTARALRGSGHRVWVAGRPGELEAELRAAGVSGFFFAGGDVLEALASLLRDVGVLS